jgi:integrase
VARYLADGAHKAPGDGESPEMAVWTPPQIRNFPALAEVEGNDLHALFWLAAFTGMRRGELLGLRWSDLTLDEGYLSVKQQVARKQTPAGSEWDFVPAEDLSRAAAGGHRPGHSCAAASP